MARELTTDELNAKLLDPADRFYFIDTQPREDYERCHIAGALNIPLEDLEQTLPKMFKDRYTPIVITDASDLSPRAADAEILLERRLGMMDVSRYLGGVERWRKAHLPLEEGGERSLRPEERPHRSPELPMVEV